MNTATISMPADLARAAYHQYRAMAKAGRTAEDRAIMLGYKAMAEGKAIIDLHETIRGGGLDEHQRPRLAVGRAHWTNAWMEGESDGRVTFAVARDCLWRYSRGPGKRRIDFPDLLPGVTTGRSWCVVPTIPPSVRPRDLTAYTLLWEAEWQAVPTDPMLLKHLDGALYVVLACWDLSPLERAVLKRRLT